MNLSPFPHSRSILSQPGCQAATSCATLDIYNEIHMLNLGSRWCIHNGGVDRGKKAARLPQLPGWEGSEQDGCARIYSPLCQHFWYKVWIIFGVRILILLVWNGFCHIEKSHCILTLSSSDFANLDPKKHPQLDWSNIFSIVHDMHACMIWIA